jgi:hypothetical protein
MFVLCTCLSTDRVVGPMFVLCTCVSTDRVVGPIFVLCTCLSTDRVVGPMLVQHQVPQMDTARQTLYDVGYRGQLVAMEI